MQLPVPRPAVWSSDRGCSVWSSLSRPRQPCWTSRTLPQHKSSWSTNSSRAWRRRRLKAKGTALLLKVFIASRMCALRIRHFEGRGDKKVFGYTVCPKIIHNMRVMSNSPYCPQVHGAASALAGWWTRGPLVHSAFHSILNSVVEAHHNACTYSCCHTGRTCPLSPLRDPGTSFVLFLFQADILGVVDNSVLCVAVNYKRFIITKCRNHAFSLFWLSSSQSRMICWTKQTALKPCLYLWHGAWRNLSDRFWRAMRKNWPAHWSWVVCWASLMIDELAKQGLPLCKYKWIYEN